MNLAFERDYKINASNYPDYQYDQLPPPYPETIYEIAKKTPRVPQMGISAGHRRTLSNISSTSSNINQGFLLENDELDSIYNIKNLNIHHSGRNSANDHHNPSHHSPLPSSSNASPTATPGNFNRTRDYENISYFKRQNSFYTSQQQQQQHQHQLQQQQQQQNNEISHNHYERPISLGFEHGSQTKLRSSLKKYNYSNSSANSAVGGGGVGTGSISSINTNTNTNNGGKLGSGAGTPNNPTPPDSLTSCSDDSSYLSAKDSSVSSQSRVRFSPETLLDLPMQGQNMDPTIPLQAAQSRRMSRRHTGDLNS